MTAVFPRPETDPVASPALVAEIAARIASEGSLSSALLARSLPAGVTPSWVVSGSSILSLGSFNGSTDGTRINTLLTQLGGPGTVFLPQGTAGIDTKILLGAGQSLIGTGWGCVLAANNNLNDSVIGLASVDSSGVSVRNLTIDGNRANQTSGSAINFNWTGNTRSSISPWFIAAVLSDIYIRFTKGDAISLANSTNGMTTVMNNIQVNRCDGNGFNIQMSDGQFSNCYSEKSGLAGWVLGPNAASTHLVNCFGNDSGQVTLASGHGFKITSSLITLTGCQSQDNSMHGYYLSGSANDSQLIGCHADSNSFANAGASAAGFYFDTGLSRISVVGCHSQDRFVAGARTQAYGYFINGSTDFVRYVGATSNNNVTAEFQNSSSGAHNTTGTTSADIAALPLRGQNHPTGTIGASLWDRAAAILATITTPPVSQQLFLTRIPVQPGDPITTVNIVSGSTPGSGLTHSWGALYDSAGGKLRVSADNVTATWAANTSVPFTLTTPYVVPAGVYAIYAGGCIVGNVVPSLLGAAFIGTGVSALAPFVCINGSTALTDPTSAPTTTSMSSSTKVPYIYLT